MIRGLIAAALLVAAAGCGEDETVARGETSPGGLDYTLIVMPGIEDVTIQVAWPTDWGYRAGVNQAAPYVGTELILAGGAEGYPPGEVIERFGDMNSEGYLSAGIDQVLGELTFEKRHMDATLEIANAHLRAPALAEIWFTRVRDGIAQTMAERQASPAHRSFDASRWAIFGDQPVRKALSLDEPGVFDRLRPEDVAAWHAETITRSPEAIVVAGDLTAAEAGAAVDAVFAGLPDRERPVARPVTPDTTPRRILLHMPDAATTHLSFIGWIPPTREGHEFEDLILAHALGGDDQSVLFEAVRTGLRASYGFGAGLDNHTRELRLLFMTGAVETAKLAEAETIVREAYAAFRTEGPKGDLAARKSPLDTSVEESLTFVDVVSLMALMAALDGQEPGGVLDARDRIAAVTEADLMRRLAEDFPAPDAFLVVAVAPDADALPGACVIREPREAADCP